MKQLIKDWVDPFRPRLSPAFFIIGAQKAGTSALFQMLARHPGVLVPQEKELHFFDNDRNYAKGIATYRKAFPIAPLRGRKLTFEATPDYLFIEEAATRMHTHFPDARLVALLRDPVKRAYSAWNMFRDFGKSARWAHLHDPRPFAEAVADELAGKAVPMEHRYLSRGRYAGQVARFFSLYGRERLLIIPYKEWRSDPAAVLARTLAHVGLDAHSFSAETLRIRDNTRPYPEPLDATLAEQLYEHFAPHLAELEQVLGAPIDLDERMP